MNAFASFVTGRYTRWFVIFAWVVVAAMAGSLQPKLQEETSNETISYLPGESDSATVAKLQKSAFESGAETPAVIVFTARDGGSVAEHQANITKVLDALGGGSIDKTGNLVSPYSPQGQQMGMASTDGKAVFAVLPFETTDGNELVPIVADVRKLIDEQADDDLSVYVTGEAGVVADSVEVFNSMDRPLLLATVVLVLVLLLVSYRSPIMPFVPLLTVAMSYMVAAGFVYLLVDAGTIIVNGQTTIILIVLMFGAGTDYRHRLLPAADLARARGTEEDRRSLPGGALGLDGNGAGDLLERRDRHLRDVGAAQTSTRRAPWARCWR